MCKFTFTLIVLVSLSLRYTKTQDFSPIADLKTLSELPLEKLLEVKSTLYNINTNFNVDIDNDLNNNGTFNDGFIMPSSQFSEKSSIDGSTHVAHAQAVHSHKRKGVRRGEYVHEVYHKKGKKGLQSMFQLSVTTLAFLAFGGYLVCLLVQAFKSKQPPVMATTAGGATGPALLVVRKGKPNRRKPNKGNNKGQGSPPQPRQRRAMDDNEDDNDGVGEETVVWTNADPEAMYQALTMLAEGYSAYQIRDYAYYNNTFGAENYY